MNEELSGKIVSIFSIILGITFARVGIILLDSLMIFSIIAIVIGVSLLVLGGISYYHLKKSTLGEKPFILIQMGFYVLGVIASIVIYVISPMEVPFILNLGLIIFSLIPLGLGIHYSVNSI